MKKLFIPLIILIGMGINAIAQESNNGVSTNQFTATSSVGTNVNSGTAVAGDISSVNTPADKATKSRKELKGDKFTFNYSYDKAIEKYSRSKQLTMDGQRMLAESYHKMNRDIESEAAYDKLVNTPGGTLPEDYYNYAQVLKINGKTDQANTWMKKFVYLKPDDLRAKSYVANKDEWAGLSTDKGNYKIEHLNVNSTALDFGATYYKNDIVFSSTRPTYKMISRKYNWTKQPYWDMYVSKVDKGQLTTPKVFDRKLNRKFHDGPASFSKDGNTMAFTRNDYDTKRKNKVVELQIFFTDNKDGKWSQPEAFPLNSLDYSVGQPCLSSDGNTMYFTSDMPGGYGGSDIYRITKDGKGGWGKAENLGNKINTEGDEMYPFVEETNGVLFYSSNGRFGLGGLDIFICPMKGSQFGRTYNAGTPLNTQNDDFAAIVNDKMSNGYFSSDRSGGNGGDDIYYVDISKLNIGKKIKGIAMDKDGSHLPKTFVTLLDDKGNMIDTVTTKEDGAYTFLAESDKNFKLTGNKETYNQGDTTADTYGTGFIVKADLVLLKEEVIVPKVVEKIIEAPVAPVKPVVLGTIYFDYSKYNIRPDAETGLDKIVTVMNDNPDMVIKLSSFTDCRSSEAYNQILSDNRETASSDYIKSRITKPERISGKGFGETRTVNGCNCEGAILSDCSEAEHQLNRRTDFVIVK